MQTMDALKIVVSAEHGHRCQFFRLQPAYSVSLGIKVVRYDDVRKKKPASMRGKQWVDMIHAFNIQKRQTVINARRKIVLHYAAFMFTFILPTHWKI